MKLILDKKQLDMSPEQFLRKAGYGYIRDRKSEQDSFVRRLASGFYPRLHMYVDENNDHRNSGAGKVILNLHLDQKQPSYSGSHAHNAEYDGEVVEGEINRLKQLIINSL